LTELSQSIEHGFYQVGNRYIQNKIEAIIESEKTHLFLNFIFHDDVYSKYNWTVEPDETLDQLYAKRAWELRHKYDHLVLHFSGGSDSANILETFIRHQIPLDEIFIRGPWKVADKNINNRRADNLHAEAWFTAWPLANWAKDTHYPHLKITVTDTTEYLVTYFKNNPNWYQQFNMNTFLPGVVWKSDYDQVEPSYRSLTDKGVRVGHVLGMEKPMIFCQNGRYHVKFLDRFANIMLGQRCTSTQNPYYVEAFYWADTTAPIIIKQAHTVKKYIKNNRLNPAVLATGGREFHEWLAKIIYHRTLPLPFTTEKSAATPYLMDQFFFKDQQSDHVMNFQKGVEILNSMIPDKWKQTNPYNIDLVGVWSKEYDIGV
jgi:hypothetical protein